MAQNNHSAQGNEFPGPFSFAECQALFAFASMGIFTFTPEGHFLSANPAMAKMLGYENPRELMETAAKIDDLVFADPGKGMEFREILEKHSQVERYGGAGFHHQRPCPPLGGFMLQFWLLQMPLTP